MRNTINDLEYYVAQFKRCYLNDQPTMKYWLLLDTTVKELEPTAEPENGSLFSYVNDDILITQ